MITPEMSVNTKGWSPGQRVDLLRSFVKEYNCENIFPWEDGFGGFDWAPNKDLPIYGGHGAESLIRVQQWVNLTEEEAMCIRFHMGAYEKEDWDAYGMAVEKYPNVLYTHTADMAASRLLEE